MVIHHCWFFPWCAPLHILDNAQLPRAIFRLGFKSVSREAIALQEYWTASKGMMVMGSLAPRKRHHECAKKSLPFKGVRVPLFYQDKGDQFFFGDVEQEIVPNEPKQRRRQARKFQGWWMTSIYSVCLSAAHLNQLVLKYNRNFKIIDWHLSALQLHHVKYTSNSTSGKKCI